MNRPNQTLNVTTWFSPAAFRRLALTLIGVLAISGIAYKRQRHARLDGVWRTSYSTDSGVFAFSLTLVEDDSGGVTGTGGVRAARTSPAFIVRGLARSSSVALVLASIGGDSSVFQGQLTNRDSLVGTLYGGQGKPPKVLVLGRLRGAAPLRDSE